MGLFGFLKKGSEEKADPQVQEVMLQDLADWFETARAAELKDMREKAEKMHNSLADRSSDIKERLDDMDSSRVNSSFSEAMSPGMAVFCPVFLKPELNEE